MDYRNMFRISPTLNLLEFSVRKKEPEAIKFLAEYLNQVNPRK